MYSDFHFSNASFNFFTPSSWVILGYNPITYIANDNVPLAYD